MFKTRLDKVLCSQLWVTLLWQGFGLDDPQRSLPTPTILWFCDQPGHLFGVAATRLLKLIKAARNFPTGLASLTHVLSQQLQWGEAQGFNFCCTSFLLTPSMSLPLPHGLATSTPTIFCFRLPKVSRRAGEGGEALCGSKTQTQPLKANIIFRLKDFKFLFFPKFIFRTMVKHTNPGGL